MLYKLLVKPCQSGKTYNALNRIKNLIKNNEKRKKLNRKRKKKQKKPKKLIKTFVFLDNIHSDLTQFVERLKEELKELKYNFICVSHKSDTKNVDQIMKKIEDIDIIICLNNKYQLQKIKDVIEKTNYKLYIFCDEADKFINKRKRKSDFENFINFCTNQTKNIICFRFITATPNKIYNKFPNIKTINDGDNYNNYYGLDIDNFIDNPIKYGNIEDGELCVKTSNDYIIVTIINNKKIFKNNKSNIFAPSSIKNKDQENLVERVIKEIPNMYCLIINQNGYLLYYNDTNNELVYETITEKKHEKPEDTIARIYKKYKLKNKPFLITGNKKIERGKTFMSKKIIFTHGIFSHEITNPDTQYQFVGRLTGRIKNLIKNEIKIFCTDEFKNNVLKAQKDAMS